MQNQVASLRYSDAYRPLCLKRKSLNRLKSVGKEQDMESVSLLVPVYNAEKFLPRCLDSLVSQTWKNTEIIIVNDGSTDSSLQIAKSYASQYPGIRIYTYPNSGISRTRNRLLQHASGQYVMFVDADDYLDPHTLEVMVQEARKKDLDMVQCGFVMEYGPVRFYRPGSGHKQFTPLEALHALSQDRNLNNYPWGKLTKRSCFNGVSFPENMPGFEDTYTIFKTMIPARRIGTIPDRFYHYVQHRGSITNNMSLSTVYLMRQAYEYQQAYLQKRFPQEHFSYDLQYYNTDMVIIYTLIVFCHRKDDPAFVPAEIDWSQLPLPETFRLAYQAWLGIAKLKLGPDVEKKVEPSVSQNRENKRTV